MPALAGLLPDKDLSHMARYALERIPAPEAAQALRDALPKVSGALKIGVIGSLGARRDAASVPALAALLGDADKAVACAAACALGDIGTPEAAKALGEFAKKAPEGVKPAVADGCLACAERLLADGKKAEAVAVYKSLSGEDQPKHVRLAATRGLLAAAGKKGLTHRHEQNAYLLARAEIRLAWRHRRRSRLARCRRPTSPAMSSSR